MSRIARALIPFLAGAAVAVSALAAKPKSKPVPLPPAPRMSDIDVGSLIRMRVMTFNVMCDFCAKGNENGTFDDRLAAVADTINRHDPDLVSLQELRTAGHVRKLLALLKEKYTPIFAEGWLLSYADPTLLVRASRYEVLSKDGLWLGPHSPDFGFGWKKLSFPRRVEFAQLKDIPTGQIFIFAGSHFDNHGLNREESAALLARRFGESPIPVIFAGDTNLRPDRGGYATLSRAFRDTFTEVATHPYEANGPTVPADGCNLEKAPTFPECRIDHVLLSRNGPWKTQGWTIDAYRYPGTKGFISDHRAVVVELSF